MDGFMLPRFDVFIKQLAMHMNSENMNDNKAEKFFTRTWVVILGAMLCCALWGSAFTCIKLGYSWSGIDSSDTASIILYAGIRFFLAGIFAVIIGSVIQKRFIKPSRKSLPKVSILALFQTILQYFFFYVGLAHLSSVKASILDGMNVFFAVLISGLVFRLEKVTARKIIGCIIGTIGIVLVNVNSFNLTAIGGLFSEFRINGEGFILLSALSYAFSSVLLKKFSKNDDPVMLSGYQFIVGGAVMISLGAAMGGHMSVINGKGIVMLCYLGILSAVAYSLWGMLLKYNHVSKVLVFGFMTQIFGVIIGAIVFRDTENLTLVALTALILVCIGIFIVDYQKKDKTMGQ